MLRFEDNHIFAPANYIIYAGGSTIIDAIITGNTYSNATSVSPIATNGGYALTFGKLTTLIIRDNIFKSFSAVAQTSGTVTNLTVSDNYTQ